MIQMQVYGDFNLASQLAFRNSLFQQGSSRHLFSLEVWSALEEESSEQERVLVIGLYVNSCLGSCIEKPPLNTFCFSVSVLVLSALVCVHGMSDVTFIVTH